MVFSTFDLLYFSINASESFDVGLRIVFNKSPQVSYINIIIHESIDVIKNIIVLDGNSLKIQIRQQII
jgi:hypothetical protein